MSAQDHVPFTIVGYDESFRTSRWLRFWQRFGWELLQAAIPFACIAVGIAVAFGVATHINEFLVAVTSGSGAFGGVLGVRAAKGAVAKRRRSALQTADGGASAFVTDLRDRENAG